MESIITACDALDLSWLRTSIGSFQLTIEQKQVSDTVYSLFYYENDARWRWHALYDKEVEDYMVRISMPLVDFVDISFIREELDPFIDNLRARYEDSLSRRFINPMEHVPYQYRQQGIHIWDYESVLPPVIGDFHRDVTPSTGISMINGSYVIGTYVKDGEETGIVLFYNAFREEYFAELRTQGYPGITHELDATTLDGFETVLERHLASVLQELNG